MPTKSHIRIVEVTGSNPVCSTTKSFSKEKGFCIMYRIKCENSPIAQTVYQSKKMTNSLGVLAHKAATHSHCLVHSLSGAEDSGESSALSMLACYLIPVMLSCTRKIRIHY